MAIEDAGFLIPIFLNSPLRSAHIANAISSRISAALAVHLLMQPPPPIVLIGVCPILINPLSCVFLVSCLTRLYKIVIFFSALLALLLYLAFDVILLSILPSILPGHNLADPFHSSLLPRIIRHYNCLRSEERRVGKECRSR